MLFKGGFTRLCVVLLKMRMPSRKSQECFFFKIMIFYIFVTEKLEDKSVDIDDVQF